MLQKITLLIQAWHKFHTGELSLLFFSELRGKALANYKHCKAMDSYSIYFWREKKNILSVKSESEFVNV
jgi:hypothetical protein